MTAWNGNGPTPPFSLTDEEILALARNATISPTPADTLTSALTVMERLKSHAEELINAARAARHYPPVPTDPALDTGCEGCE